MITTGPTSRLLFLIIALGAIYTFSAGTVKAQHFPANLAVKSRTVSGGVLNGKAISKPQPAYPAIARGSKAHGVVVVQVLVDEAGNVIAANAVRGHAKLRDAAVKAARGAKFSPTLLSGQPVKVSGVITYNFVLQ